MDQFKNHILVSDYELMNMAIIEHKATEGHRHREPELLYCMRGSLCCCIGQERVDLEKGDFILIPQDCRHSFHPVRNPMIMIVKINSAMSRKYVDVSKLGGFSRELEPYQADNIRKKLTKLVNLYFSGSGEMKMLRQSVCFELLYYCSLYLADRKQEELSEADRRRAAISRFIGDNYHQPIKLGDVAMEMGLSEVYLSKIFKSLFDMNYHDYLTRFRLEESLKSLVSHPEYSVLRVAMDNGFPNITSFNKEFKKVYTKTPQEYRLEYLRKNRENQLADKYMEKIRIAEPGIVADEISPSRDLHSEVSCMVTAGGLYEQNWRRVINGGQARDLLRSDVQEHIVRISSELQLEYIRFWNIYDEELQMIVRDDNNSLQFDFTMLDRILDYLQRNNLLPYINIGFKPFLLLYGEEDIIVKSENYVRLQSKAEYGEFIRAFVTHCCKRYGVGTVSKWYLEFWYDDRNEKTGSAQLFMEQFIYVRDIIKRIVPDIRIGGVGEDAECLKTKMQKILPMFDFLSGYSFSDRYHCKESSCVGQVQARVDDLLTMICRMKELSDSLPQHPEVHISEWSYSVSNRNSLNDGPYKASYLVKKCMEVQGKADVVAYWMASDLNSEYRAHSAVFGGTGLLTRHGIRKPAFYAFLFLRNLGNILLYKDENTMVTKGGQGDYRIISCNYKELNLQGREMPERNLGDLPAAELLEDMDPLTCTYELKEAENGTYLIKSSYINEKYGSIFDILPTLQGEEELSREDIQYLINHCVPQTEAENRKVTDRVLSFQKELYPSEIRYIHVTKIK